MIVRILCTFSLRNAERRCGAHEGWRLVKRRANTLLLVELGLACSRHGHGAAVYTRRFTLGWSNELLADYSRVSDCVGMLPRAVAKLWARAAGNLALGVWQPVSGVGRKRIVQGASGRVYVGSDGRLIAADERRDEGEHTALQTYPAASLLSLVA